MDGAEKERVTEQLRALMESLSREQDSLYVRLRKIEEALSDLTNAWERLNLGPLPKPLGKPHPCGWVIPDASEVSGIGMTPHVRAILRANADSFMSPTDVRNVLGEAGFDLSDRANVMAEIHTVLKRLAGRDGERVGGHEVPMKGTCYKFSPTAAKGAKQ
jgi:hypothetical protein